MSKNVKKFYLKETRKYRVTGDNLYPNESNIFRTTSAMMTIEKDTVITVDKDRLYPNMFRAFIPSVNGFIETISFMDVSDKQSQSLRLRRREP